MLADVLPTSYHAIVDVLCAGAPRYATAAKGKGQSVGDTWAIWGAGPIGLLVAAFALLVGKAERLIIVDGKASRLETARTKLRGVGTGGGVANEVHTINFKAVRSVPNTIKWLTALTPGGQGGKKEGDGEPQGEVASDLAHILAPSHPGRNSQMRAYDDAVMLTGRDDHMLLCMRVIASS